MSITTTVEHVVEIDAPPDAVFDLWTTADGLGAWWGDATVVEARPGGSIRVDIDGEHIMVGEFVTVERPHRLVFTFGWEGGEPAPSSTTVTVDIEAAGAGTRLVLRHAGLPVEMVASHVRGWVHFLGDRLAAAT